MFDNNNNFHPPLKNISLIWRRHHSRWRAAKIRPILGAQGLWAGRDLYRATLTVTRGLGFPCLIRRTAPFSRLLRHTRGCGGPILTRILTGRKFYQFISKWRVIYLMHSSILRRIWLNYMAFCLVFMGSFTIFTFVFRISKFLGLSITEETLKLVEMRIWCIEIGLVINSFTL
jgi:hypothetical protein